MHGHAITIFLDRGVDRNFTEPASEQDVVGDYGVWGVSEVKT